MLAENNPPHAAPAQVHALRCESSPTLHAAVVTVVPRVQAGVPVVVEIGDVVPVNILVIVVCKEVSIIILHDA